MSDPLHPEEIALQQHSSYYAAGGYDEGRLRWTVKQFLPDCRGQRILEIGCGDGRLLGLLPRDYIEAFGVDASESGVRRCCEKGITAYCLDVSSTHLPFADGRFDCVVVLETLEHLMNPYYAILEIRRVLREKGKLVCSIPNPWTGHPYLYPGLFEYHNFRKFLGQMGFQIVRVEPWEWAPRESFLPRAVRHVSFLRSRYTIGVARRAFELIWKAAGRFPWFCYWLWTFECINQNREAVTLLEEQSAKTRPKGRVNHED